MLYLFTWFLNCFSLDMILFRTGLRGHKDLFGSDPQWIVNEDLQEKIQISLA